MLLLVVMVMVMVMVTVPRQLLRSRALVWACCGWSTHTMLSPSCQPLSQSLVSSKCLCQRCGNSVPFQVFSWSVGDLQIRWLILSILHIAVESNRQLGPCLRQHVEPLHPTTPCRRWVSLGKAVALDPAYILYLLGCLFRLASIWCRDP